jgi:hypothetical protein
MFCYKQPVAGHKYDTLKEYFIVFRRSKPKCGLGSFDEGFLYYGYEEVYSAKIYTGLLLPLYVIVPPQHMKV